MKVDKYDRQIRLWGVKGQRKLGGAKVALVGCSGAGIETLKNLVLPGIGEIQIWDETQITVQDLSSTFFYEYDAVGSPKCQQAMKNLLEMNPDVKGKSHKYSLEDFLANEPQTLKQYSLVIFDTRNSKQIAMASQKMDQLNIPCIFVGCLGHYYYVRLQKKMHFVESSSSQVAKKFYLSIQNPFPHLRQYSEKWNIFKLIEQIQKFGGELTKQQEDEKRELLRTIGNIPYPIILSQIFLHLPQDSRKRKDIDTELRRLKDKIHENYRENFNEAIVRILDLYQTADNFINNFYLIDDSNEESPFAQFEAQLQKNRKNWPDVMKFLILAQKFYKKFKKVPQPTNLPDMHTTTQNYIELKNIYKQKHFEDIDELLSYYKQEFGEDLSEEQHRNASDLYSNYINNIENLEIMKIRPYFEELYNPQATMFCYTSGNQQALYATYRSYLQFKGSNPEKQISPSNFEQLKKICHEKVLTEIFKESLLKGFSEDDYKNNLQVLDNYLKDVCRSRGTHRNINICSMAGAVAAQESIKLISGCFHPMNSGYLFDGAHGNGHQLCL